jgi:hypothetical protein
MTTRKTNLDPRSLIERMSAIGYTITEEKFGIDKRIIRDSKGAEVGKMSPMQVIEFLHENE